MRLCILSVKSSPDNIITNLVRFKAFANGNSNVTLNIEFGFDRVEIVVRECLLPAGKKFECCVRQPGNVIYDCSCPCIDWGHIVLPVSVCLFVQNLTLSEMTYFRLFIIERVRRQQYQF